MDAKNERIAADFDRLASLKASNKPRWDHNNHYYKRMIQSIPPELPRSAPALDIGCGTGELCRLLTARFDRVIGVDLSGISDFALHGLAFLPNRILEWHHNRHNPLTETEKALWREHGKHDVYMSVQQIRELADIHLVSHYRLRRLLFFRYLLTYIKTDE